MAMLVREIESLDWALGAVAVAAAGVRFAALGVLGFLFSVLFCSLDYRSDV